MSGSVEYGKCQCCGKEAILTRTYFYYDIDCTCCGSIHNGKKTHFELIRHCSKCVPKEPTTIKVHLTASKYKVD